MRIEYISGKAIEMHGDTKSQNIVTGNFAILLRNALRGTPYRVFSQSIETRIEAADCFFYPDVVVTCDARDRLTPAYVSHPSLVVEVLSESTAAFDRGAKFAAYRKLESLKEYILVDVEAQRVEAFRRNDENHWVLYDYGSGETVAFASLSLQVRVDEILDDTQEEATTKNGENLE